MNTALSVARVAKLVALLGFVFPWVLVSCSGEPIERLTGLELATGGLDRLGAPNLWVTVSLAAVLIGIVAGFLAPGRRAILAILVTALVALVASAIGVADMGANAQVEPPPPQQGGAGGRPIEPSVIALGQARLQYGYFITLTGLAVAIGACGVALARRRDDGNTAAGPP